MNSPATTEPIDSFARIISTPVTSRTKCANLTVKQKLLDMSTDEMAALMKEAADAHHKFEVETGTPDADWPKWYATYIKNKLLSPTQPDQLAA